MSEHEIKRQQRIDQRLAWLEKGEHIDVKEFIEDVRALLEAARSTIAAPAQAPAYPEGEVVGACVCGSWPGGRCFKCPWVPAAHVQEPEGYSDEWILEQFRRTLILLDEKEPLVKALRIFGNRVLMQFGDSEGMHRAFSEAYERDKAERSATPASTAAPVVPEGFVLVPIEPTPEMMQAAWDKANELWRTPEADDPLPGHQYRAMLNAAPKPDA